MRVREEIERFDAARDRSLRAYFDVEQEDARLYHIVLNTERLSVDACVNAVCKLAEGPRFRDTFKSRSALANKLLEAKISSALVEHISVAMAPLGLSVSVADGKVTLGRHHLQRQLAGAGREDRACQRRHAADRQPHRQRADPRQRVLSYSARSSRLQSRSSAASDTASAGARAGDDQPARRNFAAAAMSPRHGPHPGGSAVSEAQSPVTRVAAS